jgi:hypothetical protein
LARRQKENDAVELRKVFRAAAMKTFIDFLGELRVCQANTQNEYNMPSESTMLVLMLHFERFSFFLYLEPQ